MTGGFYAIAAVTADESKVAEAFKSGEGISWGDHNSCLFCGTEKFFKPSYKAHLISSWIPALEGVEEKLKKGALVAEQSGLFNVHFETVTARKAPVADYDMVAFFDCLHDMGDPVGALAHARESLKPDGTCLIVEPFAYDTLAENLNPIGRVYYSFSTTVCTPSALSQEGGMSLGAQAGEARIREVALKAVFTRFRRATENPFNLILEARP